MRLRYRRPLCAAFAIFAITLLSACGRGEDAAAGPYAFEEAIQRGDLARAERLLLQRYGWDCGYANTEYVFTPLHWAVVSGSGDLVARLLKRIEDDGQPSRIDARDQNGYTPLMWAAGDGQLVALQLLIQAGAGLDLQSGEDGHTALHYAIASPRPIAKLLVRMLLDAGADTYIQNSWGRDALAFANARTLPETAALILAAREAKDE